MPGTTKSFIWYELMTTDLDGAKAFYGDVVGWEGRPFGDAIPYIVMSAGGAMAAGLMTLTEEVRNAGGRPGWFGYIHADDADAATEGVRRGGGAVHREPADIPDVGRFSVVADPQGAMFMLLQPFRQDSAQPTPAPATPGHVGWRELYAADWTASFEFYAGQFGWTKDEALDMGPMGTYQLFAAGGEAIGGMMDKPAQVPAPFWLFYFNVPAIDAAAARVGSGGGQVVNGPMQVPGGSWIVQCMDPQGAMFALVAPTR